MGLKTHWNGIRLGYQTDLFLKRDLDNPYTSYWKLGRNLKLHKEEVVANLEKKVVYGFVQLDELVAGGGATRVFKEAGIYDRTVERMSRTIAEKLIRDPAGLKRFIDSKSTAVTHVIRYIPSDVLRDNL
jgi:hypothetical protein